MGGRDEEHESVEFFVDGRALSDAPAVLAPGPGGSTEVFARACHGAALIGAALAFAAPWQILWKQQVGPGSGDAEAITSGWLAVRGNGDSVHSIGFGDGASGFPNYGWIIWPIAALALAASLAGLLGLRRALCATVQAMAGAGLLAVVAIFVLGLRRGFSAEDFELGPCLFVLAAGAAIVGTAGCLSLWRLLGAAGLSGTARTPSRRGPARSGHR